MGQRATLLIKNGIDYELYYCHWCANRLDWEIFWGPEYTLNFIRGQQPTIEWLDTVWAEGGVVVDTGNNHLLWFGGEDIYFEIPLRHLYMTLLKQVWKGWTIAWAH
ncbi:MAG: hypothetical protein AAF653_09525, partial [Chloroflexota bacterium]